MAGPAPALAMRLLTNNDYVTAQNNPVYTPANDFLRELIGFDGDWSTTDYVETDFQNPSRDAKVIAAILGSPMLATFILRVKNDKISGFEGAAFCTLLASDTTTTFQVGSWTGQKLVEDDVKSALNSVTVANIAKVLPLLGDYTGPLRVPTRRDVNVVYVHNQILEFDIRAVVFRSAAGASIFLPQAMAYQVGSLTVVEMRRLQYTGVNLELIRLYMSAIGGPDTSKDMAILLGWSVMRGFKANLNKKGVTDEQRHLVATLMVKYRIRGTPDGNSPTLGRLHAVWPVESHEAHLMAMKQFNGGPLSYFSQKGAPKALLPWMTTAGLSWALQQTDMGTTIAALMAAIHCSSIRNVKAKDIESRANGNLSAARATVITNAPTDCGEIPKDLKHFVVKYITGRLMVTIEDLTSSAVADMLGVRMVGKPEEAAKYEIV